MCSEYDTAITPIQQAQLTSELQGSSCLVLPGARIIGVCHRALFFIWVLWIRTQVPMPGQLQQVLGQLPNPSIVLEHLHLVEVACDTQLKPE